MPPTSTRQDGSVGLNRVAIIITNYNMPERTDALCAHIRERVLWPYSLIVVDNGSDLVPPSQYTTLKLDTNIQTTGGWLAGLEEADRLAALAGEGFLAYWFLITSAAFTGYADPLTPLVWALLRDENAVGVHPALTSDSTTAWGHLKARRDGRGLYVCEDVVIEKQTNVGYDMGRMNMSAEARATKAGVNMHTILEKRYGKDWNGRMRQEYVTNDMV